MNGLRLVRGHVQIVENTSLATQMAPVTQTDLRALTAFSSCKVSL